MENIFKVFDEIDYEIIKLLRKDARMPNSAIAKHLQIDMRTTKKRIDKLISSGAMRLTAIIDPNMFGYNSIVDINLYVPLENYDEVLKKCSEYFNVSYIAKGWGKNNLILQARFKNNEEMNTFVKEILPSFEGVEILKCLLVPQIIYDIDHWVPQPSDFIKIDD